MCLGRRHVGLWGEDLTTGTHRRLTDVRKKVRIREAIGQMWRNRTVKVCNSGRLGRDLVLRNCSILDNMGC